MQPQFSGESEELFVCVDTLQRSHKSHKIYGNGKRHNRYEKNRLCSDRPSSAKKDERVDSFADLTESRGITRKKNVKAAMGV